MNIDLLPKVTMTFDRLVERPDRVGATTITDSYHWESITTTDEIEPEFGAFLCKVWENTNGNLGINKKDYIVRMCEEVGADKTRESLIRMGIEKLIENDNTGWEEWN